jgi:hypothetical protein
VLKGGILLRLRLSLSTTVALALIAFLMRLLIR